MKKLHLWTFVVFSAVGASMLGCDGTDNKVSTEAEIAKINKNLPASDPNPPAPPTREDGGGKLGSKRGP